MKKLVLIFGTMLLFVAQSIGQENIGVRFGSSISSAKIDALNELNFDKQRISGMHLALFTEIPMGYGLYFQPEINYTKMGFGARESLGIELFGLEIPAGANVITKLKYVQVPLQLKYYVPTEGVVKPFVHLGPTIGYATSGKIKTGATFIIDINVFSRDLNLDSEDINRWEVGATGGAGLRFDLPSRTDLVIGANYYHSFTNWLDDPIIDGEIFNRSTQLYLGAVVDL